MKKVLAIVLSALMVLALSSIAFADTADVETCADAGIDCEVDITGHTVHLLPGETYLLTDLEDNDIITSADDTYSVPDSNDTFFVDDGEADDFKVTADWDIGSALVSSVKWDKNAGDDGAWVLVLKENYTITTAKRLEGTLTFEGKSDNKDVDFDLTFEAVVTNHLVYVEGYDDLEDALDDPIEAANNTLYQCDEDSSGYVAFNDSALLSCVLNMVEGEKAFMYNDEAMIDELEEKFADWDADIECYNFGGTPTFKNAAAFSLQADYSNQYYIYEYSSGKLTAVDYDWNSIEGVYEWETKSPVSYVISDVELIAADEDDASDSDSATGAVSENPDTGANDIVDVAAGLAVVSLIAAGAAALKKRK